MEDDFDMMEDDLAKMEDDLQLSWKMTKICYFLYINQGRLNPFKCSEMILNYEEKMIDEVNRTGVTYRLQEMTYRLRKMTES